MSVEAWRAALHALTRLLQVHVLLPTAQAVSVTVSPASAAGGVTVVADHAGGVPKVTGKEKGVFFSFMVSKRGGEGSVCVRGLPSPL